MARSAGIGLDTDVVLMKSLASFEDECGKLHSVLSNGPGDHRLSDHDVLNGDSCEIGYRDVVG
jgi:hypothetical protein